MIDLGNVNIGQALEFYWCTTDVFGASRSYDVEPFLRCRGDWSTSWISNSTGLFETEFDFAGVTGVHRARVTLFETSSNARPRSTYILQTRGGEIDGVEVEQSLGRFRVLADPRGAARTVEIIATPGTTSGIVYDAQFAPAAMPEVAGLLTGCNVVVTTGGMKGIARHIVDQTFSSGAHRITVNQPWPIVDPGDDPQAVICGLGPKG